MSRPPSCSLSWAHHLLVRSVLLAALRGFLRGGLRDVYVQAVRQLFASEDWSMYVDV